MTIASTTPFAVVSMAFLPTKHRAVGASWGSTSYRLVAQQGSNLDPK
jgi:hypothetical protein